MLDRFGGNELLLTELQLELIFTAACLRSSVPFAFELMRFRVPRELHDRLVRRAFRSFARRQRVRLDHGHARSLH